MLSTFSRGSPKVNGTATPPSSSLSISKPPSTNYSPSPTVIPRRYVNDSSNSVLEWLKNCLFFRYKLAAVQSRSVGTQVDIALSSSNVAPEEISDSTMGKEMEKLKGEKVVGNNITKTFAHYL